MALVTEYNVGAMSGLELFSNVASLGVKSTAGDRSVMFSALRLVRLLITNRYLSTVQGNT